MLPRKGTVSPVNKGFGLQPRAKIDRRVDLYPAGSSNARTRRTGFQEALVQEVLAQEAQAEETAGRNGSGTGD